MKKIIIAVLLTNIVAFWACERNNVEPQITETEMFLSKIQNASLDEIHEFFGTASSERIAIVEDASHLKLVLNNKMLNTDELIVVVEEEYADNVEEAPRALFVNTQTDVVEIGLFKKQIGDKEWSVYITQDMDFSVNQDSRVIAIPALESNNKSNPWGPCVENCFAIEMAEEWAAYKKLGFFRKIVWWLGLPDLVAATALDCMIEC